MINKDFEKLTNFHKKNCSLYRDYLSTFYPNYKKIESINDVPFLPVRAFKEFELKSISDKDIYKIMTSSGTSGNFSKIYLDKETAKLQSSKLIEIFGNTFGNSRFPMIVIDSEAIVKDRKQFSARTAAVNGFSIFARKRVFALDDNFSLDLEKVKKFIKENKGQKFFIFGFTFMIWEKFVKELKKTKQNLELDNAFLLHGGGWKKLHDQEVSNEVFKKSILDITNCSNVRNYYGMVEQTGSIFMECKYGNLHAANGSDLLIRDFETLKPLGHNKKGVVQVLSNIQKSYPGHSILTEDVGQTKCGTSCECGNNNNIIEIHGRLESAEIRGCSDAYSR